MILNEKALASVFLSDDSNVWLAPLWSANHALVSSYNSAAEEEG